MKYDIVPHSKNLHPQTKVNKFIIIILAHFEIELKLEKHSQNFVILEFVEV